MACFRKNRIISSKYVWGSYGHRRMFVRLAGTLVIHAYELRQAGEPIGVPAEESEIIIQWEGNPTFDSGYAAEYFPATMRGLKDAHRRMRNWP